MCPRAVCVDAVSDGVQTREIAKMYDANRTVFADSVPEAFDVTCSTAAFVVVVALLILGVMIWVLALALATHGWVSVSYQVTDTAEQSGEEVAAIAMLLSLAVPTNPSAV